MSSWINDILGEKNRPNPGATAFIEAEAFDLNTSWVYRAGEVENIRENERSLIIHTAFAKSFNLQSKESAALGFYCEEGMTPFLFVNTGAEDEAKNFGQSISQTPQAAYIQMDSCPMPPRFIIERGQHLGQLDQNDLDSFEFQTAGLHMSHKGSGAFSLGNQGARLMQSLQRRTRVVAFTEGLAGEKQAIFRTTGAKTALELLAQHCKMPEGWNT